MKITPSSQRGIYLFPKFPPDVLAGFSGREFEASKDLSRFLESLGVRPERSCVVQQVHGDKVILADKPFNGLEADGIITSEKNLTLVIRTADCAPVFFFDPPAPAIGICHVGWRGARKGIIFRMLEMFQSEFGSRIALLQVAIGPTIHQMCYEVGEEFEGYFPNRVSREGSKYFLDLVAAVKDQLIKGGVSEESIQDCDLCTACSVDQFFSARREGTEAGRFLSAIMLK